MATPKVPKDLRKLAKLYKAKGWEICPAGSGHAKWYSPVGDLVTTTASTPRNGYYMAKKTEKLLAIYEAAAA